MRIVIVNHYAVPPSEVGGTRHFDLAKELVTRGHQVTIIASNFNHFSLQPITKDLPGIIDGVRFVFVPSKPYSKNSWKRLSNMLGFAWHVFRKRRKYVKQFKPDVIIGSSPQPFAARAAYSMARAANVPFNFEVRDLWPETLIELAKISAKHPLCWMMRKIEKKLYRKSKDVICLLPGAADYIAQHGGEYHRIQWLPNATQFSPPNLMPAQDKSTFTYCYAGSHGLANCLSTVVEAAKILSEDNDTKHIQIIGYYNVDRYAQSLLEYHRNR